MKLINKGILMFLHIVKEIIKLNRYLLTSLLSMTLLIVGCDNQAEIDPCEHKIVAEASSSDLFYNAKIQKVVCVSGAEVAYSVLLQTSGKTEIQFTRIISIESDSRHGVTPMLNWAGKRTLVVEIQTRTLQGNLQEHVGKDLIVERRFVASEPSAFPNFN